MFCKLVESSDTDIEYGILHYSNVDILTLQDKICEIKTDLHNQGIDDWDIYEVLDKLPVHWNAYIELSGKIDTVAI